MTGNYTGIRRWIASVLWARESGTGTQIARFVVESFWLRAVNGRRFGSFQYVVCFCGASVLLASSAVLALQNDVPAVQRAYKELRRYTLPDDQTSETREIPLRMRLLQTRFKHHLREMIRGVLDRNADSITKPTGELRAMIRAEFKALGLGTRTKEHLPFFSFGHVLDVSVSRPRDHPDFLAVGMVIDASWTEDESLYIFQHQPNGWVNVLAAEVNDYRQAWQAQSSAFSYAISPTATDGSWFLVTATVNPHMASAWQHLTYTVLVPGRDADHPKILVRRRHDIYLEDEPYCHIKTTGTGFRIWFPVGFSPAEERYTDEYKIAGGGAQRIAVRCRTQDEFGRGVACDTGNHSYSDRLEGTYQRIKKRWPQ